MAKVGGFGAIRITKLDAHLIDLFNKVKRLLLGDELIFLIVAITLEPFVWPLHTLPRVAVYGKRSTVIQSLTETPHCPDWLQTL